MRIGVVSSKLKMALTSGVGIGALVFSTGAANAQSSGAADASRHRPASDESDSNSKSQKDGGDIVVTGTHITGAVSASPLYVVTDEQIKLAGQHDVGEVVRSLPFNFSGGQNPGVMQGAIGLANQNLTNGSAANLRGLGPDATLTLLNGHRLAYNGLGQSVDISSIPLAAVSSIQIVPDGSSALYGSDAVGGVVNITLKPDFSGLETATRFDIPTDGGGFRQTYDGTAGLRWKGGGLMLTGEYQHQNPVTSDQRDYTEYMNQPADLLAGGRQISALVTGHQDLGENVTFSLDSFYNSRKAYIRFSPSSTTTRYDSRKQTESYAIAPSVAIRLPSNWTATLAGTYGSDESKYHAGTISTPSGAATYTDNCDCNEIKSAEAGLEGPLFDLGGGPIRIAFGGGYREASYFSITYPSNSRKGGYQKVSFGYGELNMPLFSDQNALPGIHQLVLSAAMRYEHNNAFGGVTTPKLGVIYSPVSGVNIKGTWGRSFKAPTLLQQYELSYVLLYPAAWMGATGLPTSAAVIVPYGGNPGLKPERSENWSATLEFEPESIPGLRASLSYYHVNYRDRIVQPIDLSTALTNPAYAQFIQYAPSAALQQSYIDAAQRYVSYAGNYDPANVIAIAESRYINAAHQRIEGVDLSAAYASRLAGGDLNLSGQASWLKSNQSFDEGSPVIELAGYTYNPPHWRFRGGASWATPTFNAALFVNYLAGVKDQRLLPPVDGDSMTTVDLNIGKSFAVGGDREHDLRVALSIQNLFNARPPYMKPLSNAAVNYDSTNYSALGRVVGLSVSKRW